MIRAVQTHSLTDEHWLLLIDIQFIPYCDKQGCHWIGELHLDWSSAHREGTGHLEDIWRLSEIKRLSPPPRARPAARVA